LGSIFLIFQPSGIKPHSISFINNYKVLTMLLSASKLALRAQLGSAVAVTRSLQPALNTAFYSAATPTTTSDDPLKADLRTEKAQEKEVETDQATKDSIRHAAEGNVTEAVKDVGKMAKNAATGAVKSGKLMADSLKKKAQGENPEKEAKGI
jgi:hypothetical protein